MDAFSERINAAIAEGIHSGEISDDGKGMPGGWALVATYIDDEGKTCTAFAVNNNAKVHETLGLMALGTAVWEDEARNWVQGL
jgi:hypothetical protein